MTAAPASKTVAPICSDFGVHDTFEIACHGAVLNRKLRASIGPTRSSSGWSRATANGWSGSTRPATRCSS